MQRRTFIKQTATAGLSVTGLGNLLSRSAAAAGAPTLGGVGTPKARTLRIIHSTNLNSLDPLWTTAVATKNFAFLTYDQLVALDQNYVPRPQMAEGWTIGDNGRTYVFKLRQGLKFHDGEPVRSNDCIASIARWSKLDGFGRIFASFLDRMELIDDRSFRIKLNAPFPLLPAALGKSSSSQCFIFPERLAKTPTDKQITEAIGSGPYRFLRNEWVSGVRAAWGRFEGYIPRSEPVSGIAGGRIPAVDRVQWSIISDASTAFSALVADEQDYWDKVPTDLVDALAANASIKIDVRDRAGTYLMLQLNHLQAPFNNPAIRRAVALGIDQKELIRAISRPGLSITQCESYFSCDANIKPAPGSEILRAHSVEKAAKALKDAGYAGEKVVLLMVTDDPNQRIMAQMVDALLRKIGFRVDLVTTDSATLMQRRTSREPTDKGGWSAFVTTWSGSDILNPAVHQMLHGRGTDGWYGWPKDDSLEQLKAQWVRATTPTEQARLLQAIESEAFKTVPYIPLGKTYTESAFRSNLTGVFPSLVNGAFWNIGKKA